MGKKKTTLSFAIGFLLATASILSLGFVDPTLPIGNFPSIAAHTFIGNSTGSSAQPTAVKVDLANDTSGNLPIGQFPSIAAHTFIGNSTGGSAQPTAVKVDLANDTSGNLPIGQFPSIAAHTFIGNSTGGSAQPTAVKVDLTADVSGVLPNANGGGTGNQVFPGAPQFSTSDTLTNASLTTEQVFATKATISANTLTTNKIIKVFVGADFTSTTNPTWTFRLKLCAVSGCGSGTIVNLYVSNGATWGAGTTCTGCSSGAFFILQGTAAAGASVAVQCSIMSPLGAGTGFVPFTKNSLATQATGIPTNGTLFLQASIQYNSTTGTNSMTLTQLVVE